MASDFSVILDACVLVQAAVRDTLLRLFERRLFLARWTDEIMDEVVRTLDGKLHRTPQEAAGPPYFPDAAPVSPHPSAPGALGTPGRGCGRASTAGNGGPLRSLPRPAVLKIRRDGVPDQLADHNYGVRVDMLRYRLRVTGFLLLARRAGALPR